MLVRQFDVPRCLSIFLLHTPLRVRRLSLALDETVVNLRGTFIKVEQVVQMIKNEVRGVVEFATKQDNVQIHARNLVPTCTQLVGENMPNTQKFSDAVHCTSRSDAHLFVCFTFRFDCGGCHFDCMRLQSDLRYFVSS